MTKDKMSYLSSKRININLVITLFAILVENGYYLYQYLISCPSFINWAENRFPAQWAVWKLLFLYHLFKALYAHSMTTAE